MIWSRVVRSSSPKHKRQTATRSALTPPCWSTSTKNTKRKSPFRGSFNLVEGDSNSHGSPRYHLKIVCLPVPPSAPVSRFVRYLLPEGKHFFIHCRAAHHRPEQALRQALRARQREPPARPLEQAQATDQHWLPVNPALQGQQQPGDQPSRCRDQSSRKRIGAKPGWGKWATADLSQGGDQTAAARATRTQRLSSVSTRIMLREPTTTTADSRCDLKDLGAHRDGSVHRRRRHCGGLIEAWPRRHPPFALEH